MERDFRDRAVLAIITDTDIKRFIVKKKLKFLLSKIWNGKDSQMIDGKISHFSRTMFMKHLDFTTTPGVTLKF
jgi:hypothetical protein